MVMHTSNRSKTGLEENLLKIRDNTICIIALYLKGIEQEEIARRLNIATEEVAVTIKMFEDK